MNKLFDAIYIAILARRLGKNNEAQKDFEFNDDIGFAPFLPQTTAVALFHIHHSFTKSENCFSSFIDQKLLYSHSDQN